MALVEKPSVAGQADDFDFLSADEVHALLAWATANQPTEYPLYATAVYGGMRMGELFGLALERREPGTGADQHPTLVLEHTEIREASAPADQSAAPADPG